jgi:hypothetical protein
LEANNFRRMVLELDLRFPGLGRQIEKSMAVADRRRDFSGRQPRPAQPRQRDLPDFKIGGG